MSNRVYRNPFTHKTFLGERACVAAINRDHQSELSQMGVSARQVMFNHRTRKPLGQKTGTSVISGRPTAWNEKAGCYQRFADEAERAQYRQTFIDRMKRVHGKEHLLDSPEHQRVMLANRRISGEYKFADGTVKNYTGREELALAKFLNEALEWPGVDVSMPAPQNIPYVDETGRTRIFIPDAFIESLNLIVEVKGELHQGFRLRDIAVEKAKDETLGTSGYNYIKVEEQSYGDLLDAMATAAFLNEKKTNGK